MRYVLTLLAALSVAASAEAQPKAGQLEQKAQKLVARFDAMQSKPDKRVPAEVLAKAQGIILMDRTKAGFVFAYQGGTGIAMAKDKSGDWGPIAFMKANEASLGFQIGGQQSFIVILMMNKDSAAKLGEPTIEFGGEARGTAGDASAGEEGIVKSDERTVLGYDERSGLFGGASIKGGEISPDATANGVYYAKYEDYLTTKEILFDKKVTPTKAAQKLAEKIVQYSKNKS